ncbi:MAG TPA: hypothetical protein VI934_01390 [Candidatus Nanoarchaeia archaeon]|nr:hypothetical protein [Candidatus Nanoarchaeia archaeon]
MDQHDVLEFIGKSSYIVAAVGLIIMIALIWYKITGHSPALLDLVVGLQIATVIALFGCCSHFSEFKGRTEEFRSGYKQKFGLLAIDFKALQADVRKMQSDISEIKRIVSEKRAS